MSNFRRVYDISVALGQESIDYPGDMPYLRSVTATMEKDGSEDSELNISSHAGTHIDTPAHFIKGGKRLDDYRPEEFMLTAQVVEIDNPEVIQARDVESLDVRPGEALLFKTANSRDGKAVSGVFSKSYVCLSPEASRLCVEKHVSLVGIDAISIDPCDDESYPSHHILLGKGVLILEGLNLKTVPAGRYTLICLPLKIKSGEASPVRAVLGA